MMIRPPKAGDCNEYFSQYVTKAGDGDLMDLLNESLAETERYLFRHINSNWDYSYEEGKWSARNVLQHVIDTERVFAYRALRIGRGDVNTMPGFEQDDYAKKTFFVGRPNEEILEEYKAVREATLYLFHGIDPELLDNKAVASGSIITARACGFIIVGHNKHHLEVLADRYFS